MSPQIQVLIRITDSHMETAKEVNLTIASELIEEAIKMDKPETRWVKDLLFAGFRYVFLAKKEIEP